MSQTPTNTAQIEKLTAERKALSYERKKLEHSAKYHRAKSEKLMKEAGEHLKLMNEASAKIRSNTQLFFDKGTELEALTGKKRIEYLR